MTRVLQLRRGTTAQNDKFTGLAGEVTFDSTKHTLRVHDGVKLGGYEMARKSDIPQYPTISADDIPDDIWATRVAQFAPNQFTVLRADDIVITDTTFIDYVFDTTAPAHFVVPQIHCISPDVGYVIGDMVSFGVGDYSMPIVNTKMTNLGLRVRLNLGGRKIWVPHGDSAVRSEIDNKKWTLSFRLYC